MEKLEKGKSKGTGKLSSVGGFKQSNIDDALARAIEFAPGATGALVLMINGDGVTRIEWAGISIEQKALLAMLAMRYIMDHYDY